MIPVPQQRLFRISAFFRSRRCFGKPGGTADHRCVRPPGSADRSIWFMAPGHGTARPRVSSEEIPVREGNTEPMGLVGFSLP